MKMIDFISCNVSARLLLLTIVWAFFSCDSMVDIPPPKSTLISTTVFDTEATAEALLLGCYSQLSVGSYASGSTSGITFLAGLSSDELTNYSTNDNYRQFYENLLVPTNGSVANLWSQPYQTIYLANLVIEGLERNEKLPVLLRNRMIGEASFLRAFGHFYLTQLFGEIPIATTTSYQQNASMPKSELTDVYQRIVDDLKVAQELLPDNYQFAGNERIRANKWAATAMLARMYLFMGDWGKAEEEATKVIGQSLLFQLPDKLEDVFLEESKEAIWQLARYTGANEVNAAEGSVFTLNTAPRSVALAPDVFDAFEPGDLRRDKWIGSITIGEQTYYFPAKYKSTVPIPFTERSIVLRLAEQYLIRAEARAKQGQFEESADDLDMIRLRAGLDPIRSKLEQLDAENLAFAIADERRIELMVEWGDRWMDLKRTGQADNVLGIKKDFWMSTAVLYPIPESQLLNNPNMRNGQNPGYN